MSENEPQRGRFRSKYDRKTQLGLTIPSFMLGGVIFGGLMAWGVTFLGYEEGLEKKLQLVAILTGVMSGFYESYKAIRKISK